MDFHLCWVKVFLRCVCGHDNAGLMVGYNDLTGVFQSKQLYDSMIGIVCLLIFFSIALCTFELKYVYFKEEA